LQKLLNFLEEITGKNINSSLVIYAALCNLLHGAALAVDRNFPLD
jgi:hypothetical protein